MIKESDALMLRVRANYRCEYCAVELAGMHYEVDHILPRCLGGVNSSANLAVTCTRCNRNKGVRTSFVDPHTQNVSRIFNPRSDQWNEHFRNTLEGEVVGTTPVGRTTVALLFRSTRRFVPPDLSWDKLEGLQRSEKLYRFLNELRFRRLHNEFDLLETGLNTSLEGSESVVREMSIVKSALLLLELEMLMTRSNPSDVDRGIKLGEQIFEYSVGMIRSELRTILSILYQQRATMRYSSGDKPGALDDQTRAVRIFGTNAPAIENAVSGQAGLRNYLWNQSVNLKYVDPDFTGGYLTDLLNASIDLRDDKDSRHLVYLTDVALASSGTAYTSLEAVYAILTELLEEGGYGQLIDRAKFVTMRRRWWVLHLLLEDDPWFDALRADVAYWYEIDMNNEARELREAIMRIAPRLRPRRADLAIEAMNATVK